MKVSIGKSEIKGKLTAPPSKSYTIRGLMCAALAKGKSHILNPLSSDDTEAASKVLGQVGINIQKNEGYWQVSGGCFQKPTEELFCRDSAATLRFMTAISSLIPGRCRLVPGPSLSKRPIKPLISALAQLGIRCHIKDTTVIIDGGRLGGGKTRLPGDVSSQFVSALLLISPLAEEEVTILLTTPPRSKPYLEMTLDCMKRFGVEVRASDDLAQFEVSRQAYKPTKYQIEGDWSSASYLLALGAASGQVVITNLNRDSFQGDRIMLNLLQEMGAEVVISESCIMVRKSKLRAIKADLADCIDLLPTMAVLAAVAYGQSQFTGISRARLKESNRVLALKEGLAGMGIPVTEEEDRLTIIGTKPTGSTIDSFGDHRIAMAFSILSSVVGDTTINGAECVAKTYPEFWQVFNSLGGEVKLDVK
jgi:3-phosphoshikimate 1-carboxyvinyltransferase